MGREYGSRGLKQQAECRYQVTYHTYLASGGQLPHTVECVTVESPPHVTSILALTNLFAVRCAYVHNYIRRCTKMHGICMKWCVHFQCQPSKHNWPALTFPAPNSASWTTSLQIKSPVVRMLVIHLYITIWNTAYALPYCKFWAGCQVVLEPDPRTQRLDAKKPCWLDLLTPWSLHAFITCCGEPM